MDAEIAKLLNSVFGLIYSIAEVIATNAKVSFGTSVTWGAGMSKIWGAVTQIASNVMEPIGAYVVLIIFLLSVIDRVSTEQFTLESLLKDLIKLCMGLYLVTNAVDIVVGCIQIGNLLIDDVIAKGFTGYIQTPNWGDPDQQFIKPGQIKESGGVIVKVVLTFVILIFMLIELIIMGIMWIICTMRTLEIAIRTAMAPIALSDTFAGNIVNSHAIGFIRSFAAVCIQGVFITILAYLVPVFWEGLFQNITAASDVIWALIQMAIISAAITILMFKSGGIAKDVMGAR